MNNFRLLARNMPLWPMLSRLYTKPQLWDDFTDRQTYPGSAHRDTRCIVLFGPEMWDFWYAFNGIGIKPYPALDHFNDALVDICHAVGDALKPASIVQSGRVMLTELKAGGVITPHVDEGMYAEHFQRLHIVLTGSCYFTCGTEMQLMRMGELWWFNHRLQHSVLSDSLKPRVNLILDVKLDQPITPSEDIVL